MSVSVSELERIVRKVVHEEMPSEPTETAVDHVCSCPNCYCGVMEKMKDSDYECADCGLPLGNKEFVSKIEKCPHCGGTEAKEREK